MTVPSSTGRAPGRLDVMGGIADYSGSLVLQLPLALSCRVTLTRRRDDVVDIASPATSPERSERVQLSIAELERAAASSYGDARAVFGGDRWAAYAAGAFVVLARERGISFGAGAELRIDSDVPESAGVGSSAALEVAAMSAIADAWGIELVPEELARLCQIVENEVAGAPCGIMDQMAVALGRPDHLLALLCRPATVLGHVAVPSELAFFGIATGVKHSVAGTAYRRARVAAFAGRKTLIARGALADGAWLAECEPAVLEHATLPEVATGREILDDLGDHGDATTVIHPRERYPVRAATEHAVRENARVHRFRELLMSPISDASRRELGELMLASHDSYSRCGLGCDETDWIAGRVRGRAGDASLLLGARVTGGGGGGTVAVLAMRDGGERAVRALAAEYERAAGRPALVL